VRVRCAPLFREEGVPSVGLVPRGKKQLVALRFASVGIEFAVSTLIGLLGGLWLDGKLGTDPWLMIAGLCIGVAAGLRSLVRTARKALDSLQAEAHEAPAKHETEDPPDPKP
jgi:ATP synthase protein I